MDGWMDGWKDGRLWVSDGSLTAGGCQTCNGLIRQPLCFNNA